MPDYSTHFPLTIFSTLLAMSRRELGVLTAAFVLSLPAVTPRIYASDEIQYFAYLRSLWFDHDVSFDNEYRYFYGLNIGRGEGFYDTFLQLETDAGRRPNFGTIGCALLWAPFYAAADVTTRLMRAFGREVAVDGFSYPYVAAVAYASALYGFAAVLLSIGAARRLLRPITPDKSPQNTEQRGATEGLLAGVLIWIGTPLLFYMYVSPPYSHACSAFAVALFATIWLHIRKSWTIPQMAALGFAAALMAMVREQDIFFVAGPALDWAMAFVRAEAKTEKVKGAVASCAAFSLGFVPQLLAYWSLNGHPGPSQLVRRKMLWHAPHAFEVIASPEHGFIFWTPLAVLAVGGLAMIAVAGERWQRRIAACALLMVALQIYVGGSVDSWSVAGAFGQRRFIAMTIFLTMGLGAFLRATGRSVWRSAVAVLIGLSIWWNLALMAEFGTGMMDRKRLDLRRNSYDAFITLPRMAPALAYRYLTNRQSFYASTQDRVQ